MKANFLHKTPWLLVSVINLNSNRSIFQLQKINPGQHEASLVRITNTTTSHSFPFFPKVPMLIELCTKTMSRFRGIVIEHLYQLKGKGKGINLICRMWVFSLALQRQWSVSPWGGDTRTITLLSSLILFYTIGLKIVRF